MTREKKGEQHEEPDYGELGSSADQQGGAEANKPDKLEELTAFLTPYGKFQFKVMPFGFQGVPATFQRLMDQVLREVPQFAAAYLDDVVIFSQTWEEHVAHLRKVLHLIKTAGLTINPGKCAFACRQVEYLGHVVRQWVVKPRVGKVDAIHSYPVPITKKRVCAFVGLIGW